MRFLIVGDGPEEQAWKTAIRERAEHMVAEQLAAVDFSSGMAELDLALSDKALDAALIGGPNDLRAEALRRVALMGLPSICLHPPGETADAYYQVALTPKETGAIVVPDMPFRLHPVFQAVAREIEGIPGETITGVRMELALPPGTDLAGQIFPRVVDGLTSVLGEIESVTARGAPSAVAPTRSLLVHLTDKAGLTAEVRLSTEVAADEPAKLVFATDRRNLVWVFSSDLASPSRLTSNTGGEKELLAEFGAWAPRSAIIDELRQVMNGAPAALSLAEGMRSMELKEAVGRSLSRGRTVEMHYDEISELSSFKASMTSIGCGLVILCVVLYVLSRVGLALGFESSKYLAWVIVPLLCVFGLLQFLRFAARAGNSNGRREPPVAD
jgi:myo-inositol 2-dehydrogenase/D-chiro-inositol 1-dehydrogenase